MRCIWAESRHFHALWRWGVTFNENSKKQHKVWSLLCVLTLWGLPSGPRELCFWWTHSGVGGRRGSNLWPLGYSTVSPNHKARVIRFSFPLFDLPLQSVFTQLDISEEKNNRSSICTSPSLTNEILVSCSWFGDSLGIRSNTVLCWRGGEQLPLMLQLKLLCSSRQTFTCKLQGD